MSQCDVCEIVDLLCVCVCVKEILYIDIFIDPTRDIQAPETAKLFKLQMQGIRSYSKNCNIAIGAPSIISWKKVYKRSHPPIQSYCLKQNMKEQRYHQHNDV